MTAFLTVVGLFRGFSGQLGSLAGMVAGIVAGYLLFEPIRGFVVGCNLVSDVLAQKALAVVLDLVAALVAAGVVMRVTARFVSFLVPQPIDALAGCLVGLLKGAVFVALLVGVGFVQTGLPTAGYFAERSNIVKLAGSMADSYMQGANRN